MDRPAHATFRVFRLNRWSLAMFLMLALGLLIWPARGLLPASGEPTPLVKPGVSVLGQDFSGKSEQEARALLRRIAPSYEAAPVDARTFATADGYSYVVPEQDGYGLDVDMTWLRLAMAPANTQVEPVIQVQQAAKRLADFPQEVIRQGNGEKDAVGLLINVDWGEKSLADMLPVLKRAGVKVTFFVSGRWAEKNPNLLKQMAKEGHEIGSHGHFLSSGPKALAAAGKLRGDIEQSLTTIKKVTGQDVRYYAPHMSEISPAILKTAADLNLRTVLYSLDTVDWRETTTPEMILATFQKAKAGDLILLHPMPSTAGVLEQAIGLLKKRNYQLVTLSEMVAPEPARKPTRQSQR